MNLLINILLAIYVFVALLMMLVILMQRPKSEGLGAAFGGGVTENIFGAQTTNVLVKFDGAVSRSFQPAVFPYYEFGSGRELCRQSEHQLHQHERGVAG